MTTKRINKAAALNRMTIFLGRFHDLGMALWVILIITFLIMPVPPTMVDMLITVNFAVAFVLLMLSLYVPSALSLSTFPTLLLFTTLFRLSLNITTTRQILLDTGQSAGYPSLTMVDADTIGVFYECSRAHMAFQRIAIHEFFTLDRSEK